MTSGLILVNSWAHIIYIIMKTNAHGESVVKWQTAGTMRWPSIGPTQGRRIVPVVKQLAANNFLLFKRAVTAVCIRMINLHWFVLLFPGLVI